MVNYNIKISDGSKQGVIDYIVQNKKIKEFKVVDVGGSVVGWSSNYVDAIVDFNDPRTEGKKSNILNAILLIQIAGKKSCLT